ncbi:MAG: hypothetical protein ABIQ65_13770 [Thermoanaerobaculia bacterium]
MGRGSLMSFLDTTSLEIGASPGTLPVGAPLSRSETDGIARAIRIVQMGVTNMLQHLSSVLPFPGVSRSSRFPAWHAIRSARPPRGDRLDLRTFVRLLEAEGLSDRLPDLELRVSALSDYNLKVFGFAFDPRDLRIPERDLPWLLMGLRTGVLTRPLVIDSPSAIDSIRVGLDVSSSLLFYRLERLAESGLHFSCFSGSREQWRDLRWTKHGSLADKLLRVVGSPSASHDDLTAVYERLRPAPTVGDRLGAGPRFLLVGSNREPSQNRVLARRPNGAPSVRRMLECRAPAFALEKGCRFLSPEAALLLLGSPGVRDDESSFLAVDGPIWLSGLNPFGRVATLQSESRGIVIGCGDPKRNEPLDRLPASSE